MNEILKLMNTLTADDLEGLILRANILLEKKRKDEAEQARIEQERKRQEMIAMEKRRQDEIAELQRRLSELQSQGSYIPEPVISGNTSAPVNTQPAPTAPQSVPVAPQPAPVTTQPAPAAPQPAPAAPQPAPVAPQPAPAAPQPAPVASQSVQPQIPQGIICPYCGHKNPADGRFCENCGQNIVAKNAPVQPQTSQQQIPSAPAAPAAPVAPATSVAPAVAPQSAPAATGLKYADENMQSWTMLPGEEISSWNTQEVTFIFPVTDKNFKYYLEVSNKRLLFSRESARAAMASKAAGAGLGLLGSLVVSGIKNLANAGPKPFMEIPLAAITGCGIDGKKEFYIEAGERIVLRNHRFEKLLPPLIEEAKRNAH